MRDETFVVWLENLVCFEEVKSERARDNNELPASLKRDATQRFDGCCHLMHAHFSR